MHSSSNRDIITYFLPSKAKIIDTVFLLSILSQKHTSLDKKNIVNLNKMLVFFRNAIICIFALSYYYYILLLLEYLFTIEIIYKICVCNTRAHTHTHTK